uniref:Uncharacterized protein n=1 Tax=Arundo donax TaxID=35708 RepID=A0A0A9BF00_ARUDO
MLPNIILGRGLKSELPAYNLITLGRSNHEWKSPPNPHTVPYKSNSFPRSRHWRLLRPHF